MPVSPPATDLAELPVLFVEWLTYQDPRGASLPGFGRAWDRFPRFAPDTVDDRDPPRRRYDSVETAMLELACQVERGVRASTTMYRFEPGTKGRDRPIEMSMDVRAACEYHRVEHGAGPAGADEVYPQLPSVVRGSVTPALLPEPAAWSDLYGLFKAVAEQLEAYHAVITPRALTNQFRNDGYDYLVLGDVAWINWFGPSVLERWGGADALAGVGVFQERVGDALVVWATDAPPERDDTLTGIANYRWKWPFYNAVGRESWWKADPDKRVLTWEDQMALLGVHAPSPAEHRRFAAQHQEAP